MDDLVLPLYREWKLSGPTLPNFTFSHSFEVPKLLSGSDQSFKMDEPSLTTTSRRNLLAIVSLYCERKLSGPALPNFTFSHSFEVHTIIVGFRSSIKTFSSRRNLLAMGHRSGMEDG